MNWLQVNPHWLNNTNVVNFARLSNFLSFQNLLEEIIPAQLFAAQAEIVVSVRQISLTLHGLRRVRPEQKCDLNRIKQADKPSLNSLSASQVDVSDVKTAAQIVIPQTISTEHTQ